MGDLYGSAHELMTDRMCPKKSLLWGTKQIAEVEGSAYFLIKSRQVLKHSTIGIWAKETIESNQIRRLRIFDAHRH